MRLASLTLPFICALPIPFYFNLYTLSLISIDPHEMYSGSVGGVDIFPVPLSLISFPLLLFILYIRTYRSNSPLIAFPYLSLTKQPSYILLLLYIVLCSRFQLLGLIKNIQLLLPF